MSNNQNNPTPVDEKRWGGPGSSQQNADKDPPEFHDPRADGPTNPRNSKVSGGGGERDIKHSHEDAHRSSKGDRDA